MFPSDSEISSFTSVSWATSSIPQQIMFITDWPSPSSSQTSIRSICVPSIIAYDGDTPTTWGYTVKPSDDSFKWIRSMLDAELDKRVELLPRQLRLQAVTLVRDYLEKVWEHAMQRIQRQLGQLWEAHFDMKATITVPPIFSYEAQQKLLQAATQAGIRQPIFLISETEAAILAVMKRNDDFQKLQVCASSLFTISCRKMSN